MCCTYITQLVSTDQLWVYAEDRKHSEIRPLGCSVQHLKGTQALTVDNVLTKEECKEWIRRDEAAPFLKSGQFRPGGPASRSDQVEFFAGIRERATIAGTEAARELSGRVWDAIKGHIPDEVFLGRRSPLMGYFTGPAEYSIPTCELQDPVSFGQLDCCPHVLCTSSGSAHCQLRALMSGSAQPHIAD